MKKILVMLLAVSLVFAFTACGKESTVEVKSLKPSEALNTYVSDVYTAVGYSMDYVIDYDGQKTEARYSALAPADSKKIQFSYESGSDKTALVSETIEGAKLTMLYTDNGSEKVAKEVAGDKVASMDELKPYMLSNTVVTAGIVKDVTMDLISEGNVVFTGKGATITDFAKIFPQFAEVETLNDDIEALEFVYTVEDAVLKDVSVKGTVGGKELSIYASNFAVLEEGTSLIPEDADSYEKKITSDLDELAKEQEAAEAAAAEAASSEGAVAE